MKESTIVNCWRKADILMSNNDYIVELNNLELDIEHKDYINSWFLFKKNDRRSRSIIIVNEEEKYFWKKLSFKILNFYYLK